MRPIHIVAEENFRALREKYPWYADVLSAVREPADFHFENSGTAVVCRNSRGEWLHGPEDPRPAAAREAERVVADHEGLYIVLRPGLGYQALAIVEAIEKRSPGSVVIVVEDRLELLKGALAVVDWRPILLAPFAVLLLGNPEVVIAAFLQQNQKLALLPVTIVADPAMSDNGSVHRLAEGLSNLCDELNRSVEEELAAADVRLGERRSRREPFRVLLAGPEYGYLSEPIARGFRDCGCSVEVQAGDAQVKRALRAHDWFWRMAPLAPDLVLWMNRPELSRFGSDALRSLKIASVLWSIDSPRRMQLSAHELGTVDLHLCFDGTYLPACASLGARHASHLSLGAGIDPLPGCTPTDSAWPKRLGPDVSFVGSLGKARISALRESIRRRSPDKLALLDAIASAGTEDPAAAFEAATGKPYEGIPCLYIDEMLLSRRRTSVLSELRTWLKIYGGKDWMGEETLAECYAGRSVRYGSDLASVYYHSLINVNVFHAQCIDSTNSRVYDVLAAGGFLLTEDRPIVHREFELGQHLVTFSSLEEAREKTAYYLAHPNEREQIAREGQRHVLERHTFRQRCRQILNLASPFVGRGTEG